MAKKLTGNTKYVTITERDYLTLLDDHMVLRALKIAGIEKYPIFQAINSILKDGRVETRIRPIDGRYK
ncbi:hypothetical protein A3BBH6_06960 [Alistipes onderdonkii subsp. vulgaris]|uniref:hypothetical protein n=1 Tax=Alistipes TaxID=239759 RepID=UPI0011450F81|nr:hypothetical protein [Alistipes onderdonkii]BBL00460.1 hypothetical protein A3BBH6_06960 [Alistipes onderdonkii subsp. vulgaris]